MAILWFHHHEIQAPQESMMTAALEALVAKARKIEMTEAQLRAQRLSFVYGNTYIENHRITREMVAAADEKIEREEAATGR